ncbi:MAG TPA: hypothetical protein ENI96_00555 [Sedimenticola thiotaurini]|uniref:Peptidoglycan-binding protein CsiV n=1 Tax=Sedimenticola thiotaurini TaxID=1543721 RepID=A0A831RGR5_9GAMM|nr:hypothetical protein [Sedimenticola thiotaurini]
MPKPMTLRLYAAIVLLLLSISGMAAETRSPPVYDIELLIFAQGEGDASEQWPVDPGTPPTDGTTAMEQLDLLDRKAWRLTAEGYALSRSGGRYRPLLHLAWRQPVLGRKQASWIHLTSDDRIADGYPVLEGNVRISVARYLHLDLDLLLRDSLGGDADFQAYRFTAHRRMRSGELHYIDHPRLGVLIRIDKAPEGQAATTEPKETEQKDGEPETPAGEHARPATAATPR